MKDLARKAEQRKRNKEKRKKGKWKMPIARVTQNRNKLGEEK